MCQCLCVIFLWWQQLLLFQDGKAAKEKKKLSTAVVPSSHCLNCPRGDGELVSKFTDGLADAPRSETRIFGKLLGEHHRPSRPVRCPAWLEVKDTAGGVRVGLALAHLANCKASPCNVAERLGSGSSRACLLEPWTPREDFQPGYSRGSPRCKSRSELSHFAYLFYFFSSLNISQLLPNCCAAKTARERFHRGQIKRRWVMRVF